MLVDLRAVVSKPALVTSIEMDMKVTHTSKCGLSGMLGPQPRGLAGILLVGLTERFLLFRQVISLRKPEKTYHDVFSCVGGCSATVPGLLRCIATGNSREACKLA